MKTTLPSIRSFPVEDLSDSMVFSLEEAARECRKNAVTMVTLPNSGHPAGSLSSMEIYLAVYGIADITPDNCSSLDRDYVAISHGHTSPGAYSALAAWGFFDPLDAVAHFRQCGSPFQGHVERDVPGIDWGSGNLGQGLAAGVGFAIAQRARGNGKRTYVLMGDGGQTKGQSAEARRIAAKERLSIVALVDWNNIQISGTLDSVMPADIPALWKADGWSVLECDGHSFRELYSALKQASTGSSPTVILCRTLMGKGVSFMENTPEFHGKAPLQDLYIKAMEELGGEPSLLDEARKRRASGALPKGRHIPPFECKLDLGTPRIYSPEEKKTDNRSAFGSALADIGRLNYKREGRPPLLVFDCDLASSVKTGDFAANCPEWFIQAGIQEHATATAAGAASIAGVSALWADFGVFGLSEVYNQQRLNDINRSNIKTVLTHVGLDVGEDGMTHHAIDYVGLLRNTFGWKLVVPCDPNQTDRATRWTLGQSGCACLAMGRSRLDVLLNEEGAPFFGEGYDFAYGKAELVRQGSAGTIFALGAMTGRAVKAAQLLEEKGVSVAVYAVSSPLLPDDEALRTSVLKGRILTCEDHCVASGMGSILAARMAELGLVARFKSLGVHRYADSGASEDLYAAMGLDHVSLAAAFETLL